MLTPAVQYILRVTVQIVVLLKGGFQQYFGSVFDWRFA